jgi:hypothetical protein
LENTKEFPAGIVFKRHTEVRLWIHPMYTTLPIG